MANNCLGGRLGDAVQRCWDLVGGRLTSLLVSRSLTAVNRTDIYPSSGTSGRTRAAATASGQFLKGVSCRTTSCSCVR